MEILGFDLWTILIALLVILIVSAVLNFIFGETNKAKLSDKLKGQDWKVRSETAFPLRTNCSVSLFNDAAADPDYPPQLVDEKGQKVEYVAGNCWEEVYAAINEAEKFVYITGWSVDTTKSLLRTTRNPKPDMTPDDPTDDDDETIGELLRRKAESGVQVCVHVWNEKMSVAAGGEVRSQGLMCTHDEDTNLFFEGTPVQVVLSYREGDSHDHSFIFTHHQKSVIVDAPLLRDAEKCREEGLKQMKAAKLEHIQKKKELKKRLAERKKRRAERRKRRAAGDQVEDDSDSDDSGSDEEVNLIKYELKMKRKEKKRLKRLAKQRKKQAKKDKKAKKQDGSGSEDSDSEDSDDENRGFVDDIANMADLSKMKEKLSSYQAPEGARRIIAFVGGLDLCDGRWDTPRHSLFRTLKHEHALDFHNPWAVSQACGPREPWHDIHSKLEGAVARDVLENFIQRWHRQAPTEEQKACLLDFSPASGYIPIEQEKGSYEDQKESWNVQLFRSIDKYSATIDGIDASIQESYINAIRCAKRFLYVENQYFLGSCQYWDTNKKAGCENLIPFEIANKICNQIRKKKQFNAYILIPMYPEGLPEDGAIQEILYWQNRTQAMMNKMVWKAIEDTYGDKPNKPVVTDYLNFYCLGNREAPEGSEAHVADPSALPEPTENDLALHKTRRFSVYVHSKMMIVDDAYVIVGSANINERSLSGYRDSEIAMGAYQPSYPISKKGGARGEVHKFRMSLWSEHLNLTDKLLVNPNSAKCAQFVRIFFFFFFFFFFFQFFFLFSPFLSPSLFFLSRFLTSSLIRSTKLLTRIGNSSSVKRPSTSPLISCTTPSVLTLPLEKPNPPANLSPTARAPLPESPL